MIEIAISNKLLARSAIVALVVNRIYYLKLPQNPTYPAISFFKVSDVRKHDIDIASPRIQFDTWATSYLDAVRLSNEIRHALQREKGTFSGIKVIQGVYLNSEDMYEDDTKIYRVTSDYNIIYRGE